MPGPTVSILLGGAMLSAALSPGRETLHVTPPPASVSQRGIVLLASDDLTRPWIQLIIDGFRDAALVSSDPPALYFETLDGSRFAGREHMAGIRDWLGRKYRDRRVDLVVTLGEDSLEFLAADPGAPWPGVPTMYVEVGGVSAASTRVPGATGVIFEDHFQSALRVIKEVLPGTRKVVLMYGASAMERNRFAGFARKVSQAGLEPELLNGLTIEQVTARVRHLPEDAVIFLLAPYIDAAGRAMAPRGPCEALSAAANRPTFTLALHDVGCGSVGGLVRDMRQLGVVAGEHAVARLDGRSEALTTVPMARYTSVVFDSRQLERWRISDSALPAGSVVRYRQPNLWRDYRPQVIGALALVALQSLLIGGLVLERRRRRRAETEAMQRLAAMAHMDRRAAVGQLTASLTHELNQPLGAILRNAEASALLLASESPNLDEIREIIEDIRADDKRASAVIARLRGLLHKHELVSDPVDLNAVCRETVALARRDAADQGVQIELDLPPDAVIVVGDQVHLQQTLLNVILNGVEAASQMPADERLLAVRLTEERGAVDVSVTDSGPGFAPDVATHVFEPFVSTKGQGKGLGLGLWIARSIVEAHGGQITAKSNPHGGATVAFRLPVRAAVAGVSYARSIVG